jgi:hypothetical protein
MRIVKLPGTRAKEEHEKDISLAESIVGEQV